MKKGLSIVFILFFSIRTVQASDIRIIVDNVIVEIAEDEQHPMVIEGRVLVPIRPVAEEMGFVVDWMELKTGMRIVSGELVWEIVIWI